MDVELLIASNDLLGEGLVWDHLRNELLWVDIEQCLLHICHLPSGIKSDFRFDSLPGTVVPVENSNNYLLALQNGLAFFERENGGLEYFAYPEEYISSNRFNDGKCDLQGRFWVGSMDSDAVPGKGSLFWEVKKK